MILKDKNTIFCWNQIDYGFSERVIKKIKEIKDKKIKLLINSHGGSLSDVWAIVDFIDAYKIDLVTVGLGTVESGALILLTAGKKGKRYLMPRTMCMCHNFNWAYGKQNPSYPELINRRKAEDLLNEQIKIFYLHRTNLNTKEIEKILSSEKYFDAKTAIKDGFADKIL